MHRLVFSAFALLATMLPACAADEVDSEPLGATESEINPGSDADALTASNVDCKTVRMTAYDNGRSSPIDVITISGKHVSKTTGHAFLKMQAAAKHAGVTIGLTSGFRTQQEQQYLYNCYVHKSCNNGNLAAKPGFSNHQNGKALDLTTSSWLAKNAGKFGFARTVPSEAWHYEYSGKDPGGPCDSIAATTTETDDGADNINDVSQPTSAPPTSARPSSLPSTNGKRCVNDGSCNPGNDGSGLICAGGQCVPGCRSDAQCPGVSQCISKMCQ
jgi:hypothetical protein